jgi:hypothetical protein
VETLQIHGIVNKLTLDNLIKLTAFICLICLSANAFAQKKNSNFRLHIRRTNTPIIIDGNMNDSGWINAAAVKSFFSVLPMDTGMAKVPTEVRMCFDDQNIYILAICYKTIDGPDMVESLRRDFAFQKNDNFIFFLDPFDDQTNGFTFGANAAGAQWDGSLYEGGKADLNWDSKWNSVVKSNKDQYIFEASIPFKTIRYKKGLKEWGINFSRNDSKSTEKSSWAPVPRQFPTASLAYTGVLEWDDPPPAQGTNISLIPYLLGGINKDNTTGNSSTLKSDIGLDAKLAVTSSLNLDLTIHPDFSQVDVDKQVINLSRFELFYPEKRKFFLENNDIFGNFGYSTIRPFFSRRIGLDAPISAGGRLSGKIDKDWRIGVMDMQTEKVIATGMPNENYAVMVLQRKVFSRSNIGIIYIDKSAVSSIADSLKTKFNTYNRNIGMEYNLASANNLFTGKLLYLKSFSPTTSNNNDVLSSNLVYSSKKWNLSLQEEYVGKNYTAEVGYVPRSGYVRINPQIARNYFPKSGSILSYGPQFVANFYFDQNLTRSTDNQVAASYILNFRNKTTLSGIIQHDYIEILKPFDPTNTGKDSLAVGSKHNFTTVGLDVISKPQVLFTYLFSFRYGGYYSKGNLFTATSELGYRIQPYCSIALSSAYYMLNLPNPWGNNAYLLVGPKIDLTLTNRFFYTTYIQYNQQQNNLNLNMRLQWRYKPASDLFLVYSNNYYATPFVSTNNAFILKFTYWWNK